MIKGFIVKDGVYFTYNKEANNTGAYVPVKSDDIQTQFFIVKERIRILHERVEILQELKTLIDFEQWEKIPAKLDKLDLNERQYMALYDIKKSD